jgi:hypothetical protein
MRKVDDYGSLGSVLHFRLTSPKDLDPALMRLLREAYSVGAQKTPPPAQAATSKPRRRSSV